MTLIPFPRQPARRIAIIPFGRALERRDGLSTNTRFDSSMQRWHAGESRFMARERRAGRGPIVLISGGDARPPDRTIARSFLDLAGNASARILILSAAGPGDGPANAYAKSLSRYAASVELAQVRERAQAESPELMARLIEPTAVLITGMTREQFAQVLDGTLLADELRAASARGLVIAATGSSASALGRFVLPDGLHTASPQKGISDTGLAGLGLVEQSIIEHHARFRDRIGQLLALVAVHPGLTAFGIEDDTALIVTPEQTAHVIGKNGVIVLDGQGAWSDHRTRAEGELMTVTGCTFHSLTPGCAFDLKQRRVIHASREQQGRPVG